MAIVLHKKSGVRVLIADGVVITEGECARDYTETFDELCALAGVDVDRENTLKHEHEVRLALHKEGHGDIAHLPSEARAKALHAKNAIHLLPAHELERLKAKKPPAKG